MVVYLHSLIAKDIHGNVINRISREMDSFTSLEAEEFVKSNKEAVKAEPILEYYFPEEVGKHRRTTGEDEIINSNGKESEWEKSWEGADLFDVPTEELVEELRKREGVIKHPVKPYEPYIIGVGSEKTRINTNKTGSAIILEVID